MLRSSPYPALTADEARALYDAAPSPQLHRALWEIARLQRMVIDAERIFALREMAAPGMVDPARQKADRFRQMVQKEPCWIERKTEQDASFAAMEASWTKRRVR